MLQALNDEETKVRLALVKALGLIAADPPKSVPPLVRVFSDAKETEAIRLAAATALAKFGREAQSSVPTLLRVAADEDERSPIREGALRTLDLIGCEPRQVVPVLIKVVEGYLTDYPKNNCVIQDSPTSFAITYLVKLGPDAKAAIPVLSRAFVQWSGDLTHLSLIARGFGEMGPAARDTLPLLRAAANDANRQMRRGASTAIEKITSKEAK
jgi:HEAT repeat protein